MYNPNEPRNNNTGGGENNSSSGQNTGSMPDPIQVPQINLPKGGGAISGIEEKFKVNAVSGTSSFSIPIPFSKSRNGFAPPLGLSYNSGSGNSPFGLGWEAGVPMISRKTQKELPQYMDDVDSDTFILSGAEDLVPVLEKPGTEWIRYTRQKTEKGVNYTVTRYMPRIEGMFSIIEKWKNNATSETHWRTTSRDNTHSYYGLTAESRSVDPANPARVFQWLLCHTHDDKGNITLLSYKQEDFVNIRMGLNEKNRINKCAQVYIKKIMYGNRTPYYIGDTVPAENDFLFKTIFDYGEHDTSVNIPIDIDLEKNSWECRKDPFSAFRSGFEIRTYRRCKRVLMFHCFDAPDLPHSPYLVKSLELFYDEQLNLVTTNDTINGFSFLVKARQNGHLWDSALNYYLTDHLPDMDMAYQQHEWNTSVQTVSTDDVVHAPFGISDKRYLWIDLFSEGISGILSEQADGWFYKSNLGQSGFSNAVQVSPRPSFQGLDSGRLAIQELEGNGEKYLVKYDEEPRGFYKLNADDDWENFKSFSQQPNINFQDRNMRMIDLNGDGMADLLFTEDKAMRWYPGAGENGFQVSQPLYKEIDEEKGPAILFDDPLYTIFLADMSGDGMTDIVRITNGEICYWPNLGYGHFGAKVTMDHAPVFDYPDLFNPNHLRLADIDGSGTIDVVYLGKNDFRVWMNLNGNEWAKDPQVIPGFTGHSNMTDVSVIDFLGTGTSCLVYSSKLPEDVARPIQYVDLMGSKKPALLTRYKNNCGKEVSLEYRSSALFYLDDKKAGRHWITKLPFAVHCISKTIISDKIRETVFTNSYKYSHGYYDAAEREFRGFARVEQYDTEDFSSFILNGAKNVVEQDLHQPPVRTVSWFHTGAYLRGEKILHQCQKEYYKNLLFTEYDIPEPFMQDHLTADEYREALRACKNMPLRVEVYADDHSAQSAYPYSASENNFEIRRIQQKEMNKYGSFMVFPSESIKYEYERNTADPRISHSFVLDTDEFGNVKKSAAVIYKRVSRPVGPDAIPDMVWDEQSKAHVVYSESFYTDDKINDPVYRLRMVYETKTYEISGIDPVAGTFISKSDLGTSIGAATEVDFDQDFTAGFQKRLSAHSRSYFLRDDLSGPTDLGKLSELAIGFKSYKLAYTKNLVPKYFGTKVNDAMMLGAGYVHSEGDADWWVYSGTSIFAVAPQNNFYTPIGVRDVFGNESHVSYDSYTLLVESSSNAVGHIVSAKNDYRTLAPWMTTDANLNRVANETDVLGMVVKTAVMGKSGTGEGDTLADPTTRLEYDLTNWAVNGKPNYAHSLSRETHGAANMRWQQSYVYSDGSGSIIMTKKLTKSGDAKRWNPVTKVVDDIFADPRWLGNGRTILNNKGNPVKKYDPYFSDTFDYEAEDALVETGVSSIFYYDAAGRNIRVENPNGTFSKIEFDGWHGKSYDLNDTVKDSQWYADRGSPDPLVDPEPADPEKRAAWLAAKHYNTPGTIHSDTMGRPFYTIADYGGGKKTASYSDTDLSRRVTKIYDQFGRLTMEMYTNLLGGAIYSKTAEKGEQWVLNDVMGRLVKSWDNNVSEYRTTFDSIHRPIATFVKQGPKEILFGYMVYGEIFPGAAALNMKGQVCRIFDQAGVVAIREIDFKGNAMHVERQLTNEYKQSIDWTALNGLATIGAIDAAALIQLNVEVFKSYSTFNALNRPVTVTLPDLSVFRPTYDIGGGLGTLDVQIRGTGPFVNFLQDQDYDAKGHRQYAQYGNGLITNYFYEPDTFRLTNLITKKMGDADSNSLQNLNYTYDPIGNIVYNNDLAQQTFYFKNAVVNSESKYEYDAMYRLLSATGREHAGLGADGQRDNNDMPFMLQIPDLNNLAAVRVYKEQYEYDDCGNITRLKHAANGANWGQYYHYQYEDDPANNTNRLKTTSRPGDPVGGPYTAPYTYDSSGNMATMPHLTSMTWNFLEQLQTVDLGGGGNAWYVYGPGGNRIRKVIERIGGKKMERIYLGALEIYREYQGTIKMLERNTIHVSDNTGNIAQIDTKLLDTAKSDPANPLNVDLIRYQYHNNLGSATMETDSTGAVISYEEYHPFGTSAYRSSKSGVDLSLKRYRFSGKERDDETGLYYFGARYYAQWLGRWTSPDPAGFVDGLNLYEYCKNNPVMLKDPDGREVSWEVPSSVYLGPGNARLPDATAIANFESWMASAHPDRHYTPGSVTIDWSTATGRRGPTFGANWVTAPASTTPLVPPRGDLGHVAPQQTPRATAQPPATYGTPGVPGTRLTENEHVLPGAQLRDLTRDPRTGISDYDDPTYHRDSTVRVERGTALDKTNEPTVGDNARTTDLRQRVADGERISLNDDIVEPSVANAYRALGNSSSTVTRQAINRGVLNQLGNLFETHELGEVRDRLPEQSFGQRVSESVRNFGNRITYSFDGTNRFRAAGAFAGATTITLARSFVPGFVEAEMGIQAAGMYAVANGIGSGTIVGTVASTAAAAPAAVAGTALLSGAAGFAAGAIVEPIVTNYTGSKTAGVAAGTLAGAGVGAAVGAAVGVWFFGIGAAPGAAIGAVVGAIGGFIGSIW